MNPINKLPKAFIFDCGDTLFNVLNFDFTKFFDYLYDNIIDKSKVTKEEFLKFNDECKYAFFERTNIEILFEIYFNYITFAFGNLSNKDIETIESEAAKLVYQTKPVKDVTLFLDYLKNKNIPMYVFSNSFLSTREVKKELQDNNLDHYFIDIISSGDHFLRKPAKEIFTMYLQKLKRDGIMDSVCYIGNSYKYDIETPVKIGMYSILLNENLEEDYISHDDYLEVKSYKVLIGLIKE